MNKNRLKKNKRDFNKNLITVDPNRCKKVSMEMSFFKANIVGGFIGFLAAAIAWLLTLPVMGIARYQISGTYLAEKTYKIALKIIRLSMKLNIIEKLSYDQALVIKNISYILYVIGFLIALIILTVLHEYTHKWVWQFGFDKEIKKYGFEIGIHKLTPYCHCKFDLTLKRMIAGTIAPTITTGLFIVSIGVIKRDPLIVYLGLFGIAAGGADITQVLMLLPYVKQAKRKKIVCGDLEGAFGCVLYIEN